MAEFTEHQKNLIFRFYWCLNILNSSGRRFSPNHAGIRRALLRAISDPRLVDYEKQLQSEEEKQGWNKMLETFKRLIDYSKRSRLSKLFGRPRFSPLMLGLSHVECAFALHEIIEHERWNWTTDENTDIGLATIENSVLLAKGPANTKGDKARLVTSDDLNVGDEILATYTGLASSASASGTPPTPDFAECKSTASRTLARCGYLARLAEERVIGYRKLAITPEHKEFLRSIGIGEDKVMALENELERNSSVIGIGESVKNYTLAPYELMKVVLSELTKSLMEQGDTFEIPGLPGEYQPNINREMYYRTVAYGYTYRIAEQLCDESNKN